MKSISIRMDDELLDKLHVIADYEARSVNGQVLFLIRKCVASYEKQNGEIKIERKKRSIIEE